MSARGHHYPVQILPSPETRLREFQVVDRGLDAATAPPASSTVIRPLGPFCLPPSPPYTNSHLKRAIPLPPLEVNASKNQFSSMESEKDAVQHMSLDAYGSSTPLSPPYSPRRRTLTLLSVDEDEEEPADSYAHPLSAAISSTEIDEREWRGLDEDFDSSEPPSMEVKDLDLGEESDDWDDPLFLNAPSALNSSDGLALNLFGGFHSSVYEGSSRSRLDPPPSPTVRSSSLPDFGYDPHEKSKPLFDPSDFDVFENGWDNITSDSTQSSPSSSQASSQNTVLSPSHEQAIGFHDPMEHLLAAPTSPSRRNVIDLPGDEVSDPSSFESLGSPALILGRDERASQASLLLDQIPPPKRTLHSSPERQPFDVPAEVFQTPFNIPLLLPSSVTHSHTTHSLLFAPLEPQDIPLPESPENQVLAIQPDYTVPLHMLEESRIRMLHQGMLATEAQARNREAMLTEYIARLNAMTPPPLPQPIPVYYPKPQPEIASPNTIMKESYKPITNSELSHLQAHRSPPPIPLAYTQSYTSGPGPTTLEFLQARRCEVQTAIAMRAAERRRRKRAKERVRELDTLLQLKTGQLRTTDAWALAAPRGRRGRSDEAIVLAASGSDRHLAHTNAMLFESGLELGTSQRERQGEIMQLVAKMVFRRRDSSRPLSGKTMPTVREYVRSGLSRSVHIDESDGDERSRDVENAHMS